MSDFISWLEKISGSDRKVRAILKRSLSFEPGTHIPAYPYVEPFLSNESNHWRRKMYYLTAGLWALTAKEDQTQTTFSVGVLCAEYARRSDSTNIERRFISMLDADEDQLPYRLRQIIMLLKGAPLDCEDLLRGLLFWKDENRRTQIRWAQDFYRNSEPEAQILL